MPNKIWDFLTGTKRPLVNMPVLPIGELKDKLMALNRDTCPFVVRDGSDEKCDMVAEWKIVDAKWYQIFAKAGLKKVFKVCLKFNEADHCVGALDKEFEIAWEAGIPRLSLSVSAFRGQKSEVSFGKAYAFKEDRDFGKVYEYHFNTKELKKPLQEVITDSGWVYKGKI